MPIASVRPLRPSTETESLTPVGCATLPRGGPHAASPHLRLIEGGLLFRQQLQLIAPTLLPRALRLTRNRDRAGDLVQDTCVRALRFESSFTPGTYFKAWLLQVMYSVFLSNCRKHKRERQVAQLWVNDPSCSPVAAMLPHPGLLPSLQRALDELPQVFGRTLLLVDLQDCSYQEAASALGVPIGTVMSRLHRARRLLGEQLAVQAA